MKFSFLCRSKFCSLYQKGELLTQTPFSKVYLCKLKNSTNNDLVVKIQSPFKNKNDIGNEIKILRLLKSSDYVCQLVFSEKNCFTSYLVFDRINGVNLRDYLKLNINYETQSYILKQLIAGFTHLQNKNIIHRDIKSDNVMIIENENKPTIKIIDFGLSIYQKNIYCIQNNEYAGVYQHICPEMISGYFYNGSCDTWSLAVLFYIILSGKYPYKIKPKDIVRFREFHLPAQQLIGDINIDAIENTKDKLILGKMFNLDGSKRPLIKDLDY